MDKGDKLQQVQDRSIEIWIKVLAGLVALILSLSSFIGYRVITGQDRLVDAVGKLQKYEPIILRSVDDIAKVFKRNDELHEIVIDNSSRIYVLEAKNP